MLEVYDPLSTIKFADPWRVALALQWIVLSRLETPTRPHRRVIALLFPPPLCSLASA